MRMKVWVTPGQGGEEYQEDDDDDMGYEKWDSQRNQTRRLSLKAG